MRTKWEPIAIVGMSLRVPRANSVDKFWQNLRDGVDSIEPIPEAMLNARRDPRGNLPDNFVGVGTYLQDTELFDHQFFGLSLRDAKLMDPQQRLFIEHSWTAIENAGYSPESLGRRVSVYAGGGPSRHVLDALDAFGHDGGTLFEVVATGIANAMAMRVSYLFNLTGESVYLYTACSTTLAALDLACRSLIDQRSDAAIAGGTALWLPQQEGYEHVPGMILSADGRCRAFDADASGTVWSNGVTVVVLKLLSKAIQDGDHVRAVIIGSSMNNDGNRQKLSFAAPSAQGQADCIRRAYTDSGVKPSSLSFLEAHGTGTVVGDPLEVEGLNLVFSEGVEPKSCAIGSVKTNIGHLDPVAGLASLIKVVCALEHRELPASLHFERPNPAVPFDDGPFFVNSELRPWTTTGGPRRAGINSFGVGGTNCHVILEEAGARSPTAPNPRPRELVTLSARSAAALHQSAQELAAWCGAPHEQSWDMADVAYTRALGRRQHEFRASVVARDLTDLAQQLVRGVRDVTRVSQDAPKVAFLFPGQGALTVGAMREIYETEMSFRSDVDECAQVLMELMDVDIRRVLYPDDSQRAWAEKQIVQTSFTQPCLFVIEWALARMLQRWGIQPAAMLGHSVGEYVAACLSNALAPADALALISERARLVQSAEPGAMLAVQLPAAAVCELMGPDLDLAAVNSPAQCVVAGRETEIAAFERRLAEQGVSNVRLRTSHAFHSRMLDSITEPLFAAASAVRVSKAEIPYASNVTGTWVTPTDLSSPRYWTRHLRGTVHFWRGAQCLLDAGHTLLVEVGPGHTLSGLLREECGARGVKLCPTTRHPLRKGSDYDVLLQTLGTLWASGVPVDFEAYYADQRRRRAPLPSYPFEKVWCALYQPGEEFKLVERALGAQRLGGGGNSTSAATGGAATHSGPQLESDTAAAPTVADDPRFDDDPTARIAEVFARALGLPTVRPDDNFMDLGVQSLMLVSVSNHLRAMFKVAVSTRVILENPTPRSLARVMQSLADVAASEQGKDTGHV
jgi:acyl transferase domain-containing protein